MVRLAIDFQGRHLQTSAGQYVAIKLEQKEVGSC